MINEINSEINASQISDLVIEDDYIKKIRASYYLLGALLGKYKSNYLTVYHNLHICKWAVSL